MMPLTRSGCTPSVWSDIQEPDPARKPRICTAPTRDPCLDAKEVEVTTREIRPDLADVAALDDPQPVLREIESADWACRASSPGY
jgi:hypothetical protein